jgi:tetrahydromethanopterin S-methyltransferase subunit B
MTLNDELTVIDETIAELEGRRTEIINRMDLTGRTQTGNVITFPARQGVVATSYSTPRHVW